MAVNQQQLAAQGVFEARSPIPSLLIDLDEISKLAAAASAKKSQRTKAGGYTMLAGIIGAILGIVAGLSLLLLVSVLAIVFGFFFLIYSLVAKGNLLLHPKRLEIARQRLATLQQDAKEKASFSLRLALASKPVRLSQEAWNGRKNGRQEFFEETWLSLEGPLLDGTVVTDEIKDLTRKRMFSNARGKRKTKSRITYLVNVRLSYPKEIYADARPAEQALRGDVKLGPSAKLRSVRVTERAIVLKAMVSSEHEITPTTGMLSMGGYRILNLARRMAAGLRGNTK